MIFKIDDNLVPMEGIRHVPVPARPARTFEQAPGVSQLLAYDPPSTAGQIIVGGMLVHTGNESDAAADVISGLDALIETYDLMQTDGEEHAVTIHTRKYPYCKFGFDVSGEIAVDGLKAEVAARFVIQRLTRDVEEVVA